MQDLEKVIIPPPNPPHVLSGRLQGMHTPVQTWMIQAAADKPCKPSGLSLNLHTRLFTQFCLPYAAADGVYQANGHCQEAQPWQPGLQHGKEVRVCLAHS